MNVGQYCVPALPSIPLLPCDKETALILYFDAFSFTQKSAAEIVDSPAGLRRPVDVFAIIFTKSILMSGFDLIAVVAMNVP